MLYAPWGNLPLLAMGLFALTVPTMDHVKFQMRLPTDLHDQLVKAAESAHRSMNAEIVARLASTFSEKPLESRLAALEQAVFKKAK